MLIFFSYSSRVFSFFHRGPINKGKDWSRPSTTVVVPVIERATKGRLGCLKVYINYGEIQVLVYFLNLKKKGSNLLVSFINLLFHQFLFKFNRLTVTFLLEKGMKKFFEFEVRLYCVY